MNLTGDSFLNQSLSQYGWFDIIFYSVRVEELTGNLKISSCYDYDLIKALMCEQTMTPGSTVFMWAFKRPDLQSLKQLA